MQDHSDRRIFDLLETITSPTASDEEREAAETELAKRKEEQRTNY